MANAKSKPKTALQKLREKQRAEQRRLRERQREQERRRRARERERQKAEKARRRKQQQKEKERAKVRAQRRREREKAQLAKLRERQRARREALKEAQHLLSRARKALGRKAKKHKPVRYLSPEAIERKARELKERGAKLAPEKPKRKLKGGLALSPFERWQIWPPTTGYVTKRLFDAEDLDGIAEYLSRVAGFYDETGGHGRSPIRGFRFILYRGSDVVSSSSLIEPEKYDDMEVYDLIESTLNKAKQKGSPSAVTDSEKRKMWPSSVEVIITWSRNFLKNLPYWRA